MMTEKEKVGQISQVIQDASWDWENMQQSHPYTIAVATLRELLRTFDDWGGDEYSNEVFREISYIADEIEKLN